MGCCRSVRRRAGRRRADRGGVAASSSSRVYIAPRRQDDLPPVPPGRAETVRRLPAAAVDADRYRLVGHYGRRRTEPSTAAAQRYGDGRARRGRAAKSNQGSRACDGAVISSTRDVIPFPQCPRVRLTGLYIRPDYDNTTAAIPPVYTKPGHKSTQASLGLLCRETFTTDSLPVCTRTICNV